MVGTLFLFNLKFCPSMFIYLFTFSSFNFFNVSIYLLDQSLLAFLVKCKLPCMMNFCLCFLLGNLWFPSFFGWHVFLCMDAHLWCAKQLLEMVCEKYGGRVDMAKAYYKALTASVRKHFKGNGVIASMEHCNDFMLLGTEAISLGRVGMWRVPC